MWYTCRDNTRYGPFSTDDVINYFHGGNILGSDLIYVAKKNCWMRLDSCEDFAGLIQPQVVSQNEKNSNPFTIAADKVNKFFEGGTHGYGFLFIAAMFSSTFMYFVALMMVLIATMMVVVPVISLGFLLLIVPIFGWIILFLGGILISMWVIPVFFLVFIPIGCLCGYYINKMCLAPVVWFNAYVSSKGKDQNSRTKLICTFAATAVFAAGMVFIAIIGSFNQS